MKPGDIVRQRYRAGAPARVVPAFAPDSCAVVAGADGDVRVVLHRSHEVIGEGDDGAADLAAKTLAKTRAQEALVRWLMGAQVGRPARARRTAGGMTDRRLWGAAVTGEPRRTRPRSSGRGRGRTPGPGS